MARRKLSSIGKRQSLAVGERPEEGTTVEGGYSSVGAFFL
jgi:hypothetical protein